MNFYRIVSKEGVDLGTLAAASPIGALDLLAREMGYASHAASCAELGCSSDCWTTDRAAFCRGTIGLLVTEAS